MATKAPRNKQVQKEHPDKTPGGAKRSPEWPKVRKAWLKEHNECAACGSKKKLQCHHVKPFHLHPELELDPTNFITLCEGGNKEVDCHIFWGHLGMFQNENPNVREMISSYKKAKAAADAQRMSGKKK